MIGIHRAMVNSLPTGGQRKIAEELGIEKAYVNKVLVMEVNWDTDLGRKIVDMAGSMAAREIFQFSFDQEKRRKG